MRILQVAEIRSDRSSGVSVYAAGLIKALAGCGTCRVGLLPVLAGVDPLGITAIDGCVTLDPPRRRHYNPWSINRSWLDMIEVKFGRPDFVHFHGVYGPFQAALARKMLKRGWPYIVSPHGGLQEIAQKRSRWKKSIGNVLFFDAFVKNTAAVHVIQEHEESYTRARYPEVRTFFLPNAVPADIVLECEAAKSKQLPASGSLPLRVGYIGRLDVRNKGIDLLLAAVRLLEADCPEVDMRLTLVGPFFSPKDANIIRKLTTDLKKPDRVAVVGPLTGRAKWETLAAFDLFIHTSRHEGMPASVLEAMAFGKPCILTPGTNLHNVVLACGAGWVCEGTAESIKHALRIAFEKRAELPNLGENGRRYVLEHLTWDVLAKDYLEIVRGLV